MIKEKGLTCYAAMRKNAIVYTEGNFNQPIVLLIGGELRGLSSKVLKEIGLTEKEINNTIRISLNRNVKEIDVQVFLMNLKDSIERLKKL